METYIPLFEGMNIELDNGKLYIEGSSFNLRKFRVDFFEIVGTSNPLALELLVLKNNDKVKFDKICKELHQSILNQLRPKLSKSELFEVNFLEGLSPVSSLDSDNVFLINEGSQTIVEMNYKSYLRALNIEDRKLVINSSMPIAKFFFNPYDKTKIVVKPDSTGANITHLNTYISPMWLKDSKPSIDMPQKLGEFMRHLLPSDKQREYCLMWMATAMFGRNETYLVLNGDKGVGKNTIYEIMKAVISPRYSVTAPASLTTGHFNSVLKDKRLILLDEYKINRNNHLFLKKIINKNQTIEKKGQDADTEIETFNSFMIFHNSVSDMYVEKDDRRFSILDITKTNLTEIWPPDEIHELMIDLNDPSSEFTKEVGQYLLHIYENKEFNNVTPFKGDKFHEIVEYHMPTWLQIVIAMVENGEVRGGVISFKKDIEKRLSNEMMGTKKIQWRKSTLEKILKEYRYKDQWPLGKIDNKRGLSLIVNPDLIEQFEEELEEDLL